MKAKNYKTVYQKFFNYGEQDIVPSELSKKPATDIHHIIFRSHGVDNSIDNLIALTREEHDQAHGLRDPKLTIEELQEAHHRFIERFLKKQNEVRN